MISEVRGNPPNPMFLFRELVILFKISLEAEIDSEVNFFLIYLEHLDNY